jgi:hypothetical protein
MPSKRSTQVYYFSVGSPHAHATVWRLWTQTKQGDVYLSPRPHGQSKLSIHASGVRHRREKNAQVDVLRLDGDATRWHAGARQGPGFEMVWRIITPSTDLRDARLHPRFIERVQWIGPGGSRTMTDFQLVLTFGLITPEGRIPADLDAPGTECLLRWHLATGETLFLLHRKAEITDGHAAWFATERVQAASRMPKDWQAGARADEHDLRLHLVMNRREMHFRGCYDLAVEA